MGRWTIKWNFNKSIYTPEESPFINIWLENTGETDLYLSEFRLEFDFGTYTLENITGMVYRRQEGFLGTGWFRLPENVVGKQIFAIKHRMYEYINNKWIDLGEYHTDKRYFLNVYPQPFYRVFVSRGLTIEDRAIGDKITQMVREWGFETITEGIEVKVSEEEVPLKVREEIRNADGLIAIATPRSLDALTGLWRTLVWLHDEVGIAFGIKKPLLILKDNRVSLTGLPFYLTKLNQVPLIEFNPYDLDELRKGLPTIMQEFRDWIATKRSLEFLELVGKIAIGGFAILGAISLVSGVVGMFSVSEKGDEYGA